MTTWLSYTKNVLYGNVLDKKEKLTSLKLMKTEISEVL